MYTAVFSFTLNCSFPHSLIWFFLR